MLAVIIPAFSPLARAAIGSGLRYTAARAVTAAPLYRFWLGRGWGSRRLRARTGAAVRDMKHAVREAMKRQRLEESEVRDGVRARARTRAPVPSDATGPGAPAVWAPSGVWPRQQRRGTSRVKRDGLV